MAAFAVSHYACDVFRTGKPFNPLLGETYELEREDLGFRLLCEQVSHCFIACTRLEPRFFRMRNHTGGKAGRIFSLLDLSVVCVCLCVSTVSHVFLLLLYLWVVTNSQMCMSEYAWWTKKKKKRK